jgi:hypothetical protein
MTLSVDASRQISSSFEYLSTKLKQGSGSRSAQENLVTTMKIFKAGIKKIQIEDYNLQDLIFLSKKSKKQNVQNTMIMFQEDLY